MKTKLTVSEVVEMQSKAGKIYWKILTSEGDMSTFDKPIALYCQDNIGTEIEVETKTSGDFTNIKSIHSGLNAFEQTTSATPIPVAEDKYAEQRKNREISVYTERVIEVFNVLKLDSKKSEEELTEMALAIVIRARAGIIDMLGGEKDDNK